MLDRWRTSLRILWPIASGGLLVFSMFSMTWWHGANQQQEASLAIGIGLRYAEICMEVDEETANLLSNQIDDSYLSDAQKNQLNNQVWDRVNENQCRKGELCNLLSCKKLFQTLGSMVFFFMLITLVSLTITCISRETNANVPFVSGVTLKTAVLTAILTVLFYLQTPSALSYLSTSWGLWTGFLGLTSTAIYGFLNTTEILGEHHVNALPAMTHSPSFQTIQNSVSQFPGACERCRFSADSIESEHLEIPWGRVARVTVQTLPKNYGDGNELVLVVTSIAGETIHVVSNTGANFEFVGKSASNFRTRVKNMCVLLLNQAPHLLPPETKEFIDTGIAPEWIDSAKS